MVNEANKSVHTEVADEHEEMDFATMLEESFKDSERDTLINGVSWWINKIIQKTKNAME